MRLVWDFEEFQREKAEEFFLNQWINQNWNLKRRLNLIDSIKVATNSFIFVGDFVVTGDKLPLKVRLNLNNKTVVFQISLKVVNGGFDNSPVRQEVIQEFLLATVNFFADWNDSFLLESDQWLVQSFINLFFETFFLGGVDCFGQKLLFDDFGSINVSKTAWMILVIDF